MRSAWRLLVPVLMGPLAALAVGGPAGADDGAVRTLFRFQDPAISESSGLVVVGDLVVTVNDSGHDAVLFAVDPATGTTVSTTRWADRQVDAEALAPAPSDDVWVGDIGDNAAERRTVTVTRTPLGDNGEHGTTYTLRYAHGKAADAEALLAEPTTGRLYVITKGLLEGRVFAAPETLDPGGSNKLHGVGKVTGLVTDAAFFPDGRHLVVRTYDRAVVYTFPALEKVGSFRLPPQPQGEGLAVVSDSTLYLSSEGVGTPVLKVRLPAELRKAVQAAPNQPEPAEPEPQPDPESVTPTPSPSSPPAEAAVSQSRRSALPRWPAWVVGAAGVCGILTGLTLRLRRRRAAAGGD